MIIDIIIDKLTPCLVETSTGKVLQTTLDDAASKAGGYVDYAPGRPMIVDYDYRAMSDYCRVKGIKPIDLPEEERKQFEYDPPLVYFGGVSQ